MNRDDSRANPNLEADFIQRNNLAGAKHFMTVMDSVEAILDGLKSSVKTSL